MMKILIDNRYLPYSIDTYGMFTGEGFHEYEVEYYQNEYGLSANDFEVNYNFSQLVEDLAKNSIHFIKQALESSEPTIVRGVEFKGARSPQYYNYTTDSYTAEWDIDEVALKDYCQNLEQQCNDYVLNEWKTPLDKLEDEDPYTAAIARLGFYLTQVYEVESYDYDMLEIEDEVYRNNMQPTPQMQAKLDKLQEQKP